MTGKIDALKALLASMRSLTSGAVARLREDFMVEYIHNSNSIEGNPLTLQETTLVLKEGIAIAGKPLRSHLEAVGHRDAFIYVEKLVRDKAPFSEAVIKELHALILIDQPEDKGRYRHVDVSVSSYLPPDAEQVPDEMLRLIFNYQSHLKTAHPTEAIAQYHLEFERIHPFVDANGRTGRLVMNLQLMQQGYPPINIRFADRQRYYGAFRSDDERSSEAAMTALVQSYILFELERCIRISEKSQEVRSRESARQDERSDR